MQKKEIKKVENKYMRMLLNILGTIFVILCILGIILPVMPGTIFLILATACYIRSSDRMYNWLINNKLFGRFARMYFEERAMPMSAKIIASVMMWTSVISSLFILESLIVKLIFVMIAIGVTLYFVSLKTLKKEV